MATLGIAAGPSARAEVSENVVTTKGGVDEFNYVVWEPATKAKFRFTLLDWTDEERTSCIDLGLVDSSSAASSENTYDWPCRCLQYRSQQDTSYVQEFLADIPHDDDSDDGVPVCHPLGVRMSVGDYVDFQLDDVTGEVAVAVNGNVVTSFHSEVKGIAWHPFVCVKGSAKVSVTYVEEDDSTG